MNVVTVKVNGIEYNLKGEEATEYLHKVAGYVDKKIKSIQSRNKLLGNTEAAVLTAMNVTDELFKWDDYIQEIENKNAILESSQKSLKETLDSLKSQVASLEKYNKELEEKIEKQIEDVQDKEEESIEAKQIQSIEEEFENYKEISRKKEMAYESIEAEALKVKEENKRLKEYNKQIKFDLTTSKYKIAEFEKKLLDSHLVLAKLEDEKMLAPLRKPGV